jgi:DNA polymerase-3 subunit alpha
MAVFVLEDLQGEVEVVLFPRTLAEYSSHVVNDRVVFVRGKVDRRREKPNIFAEELIGLDEVTEKLAAKVKLRLEADDINEQKVAMIKSLCEHHRGKSPVYVAVKTDNGRVYASADKKLCVNPDVEFCKKMKQLVGTDNFQLSR